MCQKLQHFSPFQMRGRNSFYVCYLENPASIHHTHCQVITSTSDKETCLRVLRWAIPFEMILVNTWRDTKFRTLCLIYMGSGVLLRLQFIKCGFQGSHLGYIQQTQWKIPLPRVEPPSPIKDGGSPSPFFAINLIWPDSKIFISWVIGRIKC